MVSDGPGAPAARLTLYTRPGCHLCGPAREVVRRVQHATDVSWVEIDISGDPDLEAEYGGRVPVLLLDGREHDEFRVDEERLRRDVSTPA